ncbi:hypothetical protein ACRALDRAFT_1092068 [Sodiomyces alcalophilus JCM 7366]|uniref:uncharacterized protein n=1 Tax=Sodiomyces alcalophilus JCM 7366 TaxID=591952 RepID=UPI0039B3D917
MHIAFQTPCFLSYPPSRTDGYNVPKTAIHFAREREIDVASDADTAHIHKFATSLFHDVSPPVRLQWKQSTDLQRDQFSGQSEMKFVRVLYWELSYSTRGTSIGRQHQSATPAADILSNQRRNDLEILTSSHLAPGKSKFLTFSFFPWHSANESAEKTLSSSLMNFIDSLHQSAASISKTDQVTALLNAYVQSILHATPASKQSFTKVNPIIKALCSVLPLHTHTCPIYINSNPPTPLVSSLPFTLNSRGMSSFLSLKHIPCPAGNKCAAFQCLFGHGNENGPRITGAGSTRTASTTPSDVPSPPRSGLSENGHDPASSQDGPRKRQKIGQGTARPATDERTSAPTTTTVSATTASEKPVIPDTDLATKPPSLARPISPPPSRRLSSSSNRPPATSEAKEKNSRTQPTHRALSSSSTSSPEPAKGSKVRLSGSDSALTPAPSKVTKAGPVATPRSTTPNSSASSSAPPKPRKVEALNPRLLRSAPASHETRVRLVKLLHAELKRLNTELKKTAADGDAALVLSDQELIWEALDQEENAAVTKPAVYSNSLRNSIMKLKRMKVQQWKEERRTLQRQCGDDGKNPEKKPAGTPKKVDTGLQPAQEVQLLRRLRTSIDALTAHGYVSSLPTDAEIAKARDGMEASDGWEKCDRCERRFQVFPGRRGEDGSLTSGGACTFHYGKTYFPERQPGDKSKKLKRYLCCGQQVGDSAGCTEAPHHVFKVTDPKRLAAVLNYAETPANPSVPADRAVCFDCEMCYTTYGLELVRLTATAWPTGATMLDVLVMPRGEILDLNSRFSGVWPEDMAHAETWNAKEVPSPDESTGGPKKMNIVPSTEAARDLLFSLISPDTPLIGHGLENDLNAVRIVHPTLIDTVLLHPHKAGLPYRYGLKHLMAERLNRKIQIDTGSKSRGHDSAEDARAAGELVHLKLMEEWKNMQMRGWKLDPSKKAFVAPGDIASGKESKSKTDKLDWEFLEALTRSTKSAGS